jgi:probable rRNA maturation factor
MVIEATDATGRVPEQAMRALRAALPKIALELQRRHGAGGEARARIVGDEEMAALHEKHAGVPGTTDVLTFDLRGGHTGVHGLSGLMDADIVVCWDEAVREATERGHAPEHETLLYIVHACLHCLGHDDHDDDDAARMHEAENAVLEAAGVGRVYG